MACSVVSASISIIPYISQLTGILKVFMVHLF
jgi:hypothetical protein